MPVFDEKQEELEHYETMMGVPRGRLAVTMDSITDAMALVGQHGVYCQSQRWPGKPVMDIQIIMKSLTDAKELIQSVMEELKKVRRVAERPPGNVTEVLLVLDATTGQNALAQAKVFTEAVDVTGIVLTKLDGTAKGGIVIAVQRELGIPVKLVGLGEGVNDLVAFDPDAFVDALLGLD